MGRYGSIWEGLYPEKKKGEQLNDKDNNGQRNGKETREKDESEINNPDKLADIMDYSEEVTKSVEKRRDFRENDIESMASHVDNNKEESDNMKDIRYGKDIYKERHGTGEIVKSEIKRRRRKGRKTGLHLNNMRKCHQHHMESAIKM